MKIPHPHTKTAIILSIAGAVVVLAGASVGIMALNKWGPFADHTSSNLKPATKEEKQAGSQAKQQTVDQTSKGQSTGSDPSPAPTPIPGTSKSSVNMDITSANQDNPYLHIRTLIQTVTSDGTCVLTMTGPGGKTYTASTGTQALPSTSTCTGFDVPVSQLAAGSWNITVQFDTSKLTATASKTITIQ